MIYELDDVERKVIIVSCTCAYRSLVTGVEVYCGECRPSCRTSPDRTLVHVECGTPSQIVRGWDTLAEQESKPS